MKLIIINGLNLNLLGEREPKFMEVKLLNKLINGLRIMNYVKI